VEKQPLLRDGNSTRQYTSDQQQAPYCAKEPAVDSSQVKLAGDD